MGFNFFLLVLTLIVSAFHASGDFTYCSGMGTNHTVFLFDCKYLSKNETNHTAYFDRKSDQSCYSDPSEKIHRVGFQN